MKNKWSVFLAAALLAALSGTAAARDNISFSISIGTPGYTYVAPPPVYYYPAPPVYYYVPARVHYVPAPWVIRDHRDWNKHHKHWNRHHGRW